jgi:HEAT repeat protein
MRKLTEYDYEQYLKYITGCDMEYKPFCYNRIDSSIKRESDLKTRDKYEVYKKSILFIDNNFSIIVKGLQSDDIFVKNECAKVLGCFYDKRSVAHLISSLESSEQKFKRRCINSLVKLKKYSTDLLIKALQNPSQNIRRGAIKALKEISDKNLVELYIDLLEDNDSVIRYNAIELLISTVPPNGIDPICELVKDKNADVRTKAIWAMKYLYYLNRMYNLDKNLNIHEFTRCYKLINDSILLAFEDENVSVRRKVTGLLKDYVDFDVYRSIIPHLESLSEKNKKNFDLINDLDVEIEQLMNEHELNNPKSNQYTEKGLEKIIDLLKLRKNLSKSLKININIIDNFIEVSKKYNKKNLRNYIENTLKDNDFQVREYATYLLGKFIGFEAIPLLKNSLNDKNPRVRKAAVKTLGMIHHENSIPLLKEALNDENDSVKDKARYILFNHYHIPEFKSHRKAYLLEYASSKEKEYYNLWLSQLYKKNPLDFKDNKNYIYMFLYETVSKFCKNKKIDDLINNFNLIEQSYSDRTLKLELNQWISGAYYCTNEYEKSYFYKKKAGLESYEELFFFAALLKPSTIDLMNGKHILRIAGENVLTPIGKKYKTEIRLALDEILSEQYQKYNKNVISHFIHDFKYYSSKEDKIKQKTRTDHYISISLSNEDLDYLNKFFDNQEEYKEFKFQYLRGKRGLLYEYNEYHCEYIYFHLFQVFYQKNIM